MSRTGQAVARDWLTQRQMAEIFDTTTDNISLHLRNIHTEGELAEASTTEDFSVVQNEGGRAVRRALRHHNLDAIIAVGYRVNSHRATRFRIWATGVLRETIVKGFVLDDERLKQGRQVFGEDYFRELLERVRSIRASERRIWQQVTDIFAERHPLRILLAEDNLVNQKLALRLLQQMGYSADVAVNGREAIERVQAQPYDVVLMDVQMPEMDGLEASRRIVARWPEAARRPRIVAMTANVMQGDRESAWPPAWTTT